MKPTDTYWTVNEINEVICVYKGDQNRRTIEARATEFPMSAHHVSMMMNNSFELGVKAKTAQIKQELGL